MSLSSDRSLQPCVAVALRLALNVVLATAQVSDNRPKLVYYGTSMNTFLYESTPAGANLYRVQATGDIKAYHLVPSIRSNVDRTVSAALAINPQTGHIHLTRKVDFEALDIAQDKSWVDVWFHIVVEGRGMLPNDSAVFKLIVMDVNDNPPIFAMDTPHNLTLNKSIPVGKEIIKVVATDIDHGKSGSIVYYLNELNGANQSGMFSIDSMTGQVYLNQSLTSLNEQEYDLRIVARDKGKPPLQTSRDLKIIVSPSFPEVGKTEQTRPQLVYIRQRETSQRSVPTVQTTSSAFFHTDHTRTSRTTSREEDTALTPSPSSSSAESSSNLRVFVISAGTVGGSAFVLGLVCCFFATSRHCRKQPCSQIPSSSQNNVREKGRRDPSRFLVDYRVDGKTNGLSYINDTDLAKEQEKRSYSCVKADKVSICIEDEPCSALAAHDKNPCRPGDDTPSPEQATSATAKFTNTSDTAPDACPSVKQGKRQTLWQSPDERTVQSPGESNVLPPSEKSVRLPNEGSVHPPLNVNMYKRGTVTLLISPSDQSLLNPPTKKPSQGLNMHHPMNHRTLV